MSFLGCVTLLAPTKLTLTQIAPSK
ncbi:hypothetical protein LINPERPRIM_LOCUS12470 [Linum perenne]